VLMLTAVNDAPTATEVLANGAMDYLMKPIELQDLALAVERALHKRDLEVQQRAVERLIREEVAASTEELRRERLAHPAVSSDKIFAAFTQRKVWLLVLVYLGETTSFYGISLWLPSMIKNASGDSNLVVGLLSVIPYPMTAVAMVLVGMHSDRTGERKWHLAGCAFAGSIGLAGAAYATSTVASMVMLSLTMMAGFSMMGPFWATSTEVLSETSAVAGIALVNSFGNLGGFLGPYTIGLVRTWTGSFRGGLLAVAVLLGFAGGLALLAYDQNPHKPRVPALP